MSPLGCGRRVTIHLLGGPEHHVIAMRVDCGAYYLGELIQCQTCQEEKPVTSTADPADEDAQAELRHERGEVFGGFGDEEDP